MRKLTKGPTPAVLQEKAAEWLAEYKADKSNDTARYRYRHQDIKTALLDECGWKCAYCESRLGVTAPGDIEHMIPTSKAEDSHFDWINLTVACAECNRRKRDYYAVGAEFLNPYVDDVEELLLHLGPVVSAVPGEVRAEITIRILQLTSAARLQLFLAKLQRIQAIDEMLARHHTAAEPGLKVALRHELLEAQDAKSEYSAMIKSVVRAKGGPTAP